ncbi:MAG TPA: AgmX/PglI C-terminal domain-containing protein [Cellvibrio sp.]|nr:AgmX/PglI C-terminal domain-containing protein [Cellvibrio sp.]
MTSHVYHTELPWSSSRDEDQRFNKILGVLAVVFLVLSVVVTVLKVPALTRAEKEQLPPQLARVMLQKQELPPPKVVEPPKVEEKKPEEKKPEKKIEAIKPIEKVQTPPSKKEVIDKAKEQAQAQISTFKDDLMEMREMAQTTMVETASATINDAAAKATQVDRSMINSGQTKGSGGINVGAYASRDTGGVALSGRETTKVKSGLAEASKKAAGATGNGGGNSDGAGGAARSEEDMRKVMEQHKSSIFSIYNRALRDNAALQGKVKFKIVIDPSGQVVEVSIEFSELKEPALEAKLVSKLKSISFPAAAVLRTTFYQTLDFLPQ